MKSKLVLETGGERCEITTSGSPQNLKLEMKGCKKLLESGKLEEILSVL